MQRQTWSDEWKRTHPDIVVYLPREENAFDAVNQQFLVVRSPGGAWLAFWTRSADEGEINQSVVVSRSADRGATWSEPCMIDGPSGPMDQHYRAPDQREGNWKAPEVGDAEGQRHAGMAYWGFPIVAPRLNRVYCFYFKCNGRADFRYDIGGIFRGRCSDDDGVTWGQSFELPVPKTAGDNPDPAIPVNWIIFEVPKTLSSGKVIAPFTCWGSKKSPSGVGAESHFLRFDNILVEPDPRKLTTTLLPGKPHGLRVPSILEPEISFCEEPSLVELSDGRLFCVMRTDAGYIAFSVSEDQGDTWSPPAPLYRNHHEELMLNPVVPCPIWKLRDGRYLLQYYNNKGDANGGKFPCSYGGFRTNRYPSFISVGYEDPKDRYCPIRFGPPKMIIDTEGKGLGPGGRTDAGSYGSLLEDGKDRILFYPDRKHFLLGKYLTDDWLED